MPPQQAKRLPDFADGSFGFCAHPLGSKLIARYIGVT
jgi:hypothetical protein